MRAIGVYLRGLTLFVAGIVVGIALIPPSAAQENSKGGLRLNHVGIAVKDFQQSLNFYTKVMGFRVAYALPSPDGRPTTISFRSAATLFWRWRRRVRISPPVLRTLDS